MHTYPTCCGAPVDGDQTDLGATRAPGKRGRPRVSAESRARHKRLGQWLRRQRAAAALTREQAAHRAGITLHHLAKLEAGLSGTQPGTLARLAAALSADAAEACLLAGLPVRPVPLAAPRSALPEDGDPAAGAGPMTSGADTGDRNRGADGVPAVSGGHPPGTLLAVLADVATHLKRLTEQNDDQLRLIGLSRTPRPAKRRRPPR